MKNGLLVGNGFDLAHGLSTKYEQFLFLMKGWGVFYNHYISAKKGIKIQESSEFFIYLEDVEAINEDYIHVLDEIINRNSWVKYYCSCEAEIDGWIDFEREIYPVIELFEYLFESNHRMSKNSSGRYGKAHIEKKEVKEKILRVAYLWDKYINTTSGDTIFIKEPYASMQYGILKKKILKSLRAEFDEFIFAFEIYLHEFVYKKGNIIPLEQIKKIGIDFMISFNYTLTERLYGVKDENVHHIHGRIRDNLESGNNNMVIGVSEQSDQKMDFIYFVKYFQRIQKRTGTQYKKLALADYHKNALGENIREEYFLHIYGHSLDETDEDVLTYVIGLKESDTFLRMKPDKVYIYYYSDSDYEQKVINLIKLYGRTIVESYIESERFILVPIDT